MLTKPRNTASASSSGDPNAVDQQTEGQKKKKISFVESQCIWEKSLEKEGYSLQCFYLYINYLGEGSSTGIIFSRTVYTVKFKDGNKTVFAHITTCQTIMSKWQTLTSISLKL